MTHVLRKAYATTSLFEHSVSLVSRAFAILLFLMYVSPCRSRRKTEFINPTSWEQNAGIFGVAFAKQKGGRLLVVTLIREYIAPTKEWINPRCEPRFCRRKLLPNVQEAQIDCKSGVQSYRFAHRDLSNVIIIIISLTTSPSGQRPLLYSFK